MTRISLAFAAAVLTLSAAHADQDPRLLDEFTSTNDAVKAVFLREAGGIRLKTPPPFLGGLLGTTKAPLWQLDTTYAVGGDFEYEVNFDVTQIGPKGKPIPTEASAEISTAVRDRYGFVGVNVNCMPGTPKCFRTVRIGPNAEGWHFNVLTFPRKSDSGRMAMRRKGSEVILLAADGPAEPLVELVRFPHDPRESPCLRMCAYQGNQATPMPVDVLFSKVAIRADKVIRGPEAGVTLAAATPRTSYPVTIDYSRKPNAILSDFNHSNDNGQAFRVEGDGLRVKPPTIAQHKAGVNAYWYRDSRYSLRGDFEVSVRFDVAQLGPVGKESGYRTASVSLGIETGTPIGSVSLSRGLSDDKTQRYSITRHSPTKNGSTWDTMVFKTEAKRGRLVVRRLGAEMTFLVEEEGKPIRELLHTPWVTGPVPRIRLNADQGGTAVTPVNVLLSDLTVKAEGLIDADKGTPLTPVTLPTEDNPAAAPGDAEGLVLDSAPVEKSNKWRNLTRGFGGLLALVLVAAAGWGLLRARRSRGG